MIAGPTNTLANLAAVSPVAVGTSPSSSQPTLSFSATLRESSEKVAASQYTRNGSGGSSDITNRAQTRPKTDSAPSRTHALDTSSSQGTTTPHSLQPVTPLYIALLLGPLNLSPSAIPANPSSPAGNPANDGDAGFAGTVAAGAPSPAADGMASPQLTQSFAGGSTATPGTGNSAIKTDDTAALPDAAEAGSSSTASPPLKNSSSGAHLSPTGEVGPGLSAKLGKDLVPAAKNGTKPGATPSHPLDQLPQASKPTNSSLPASSSSASSAKSEAHQGGRHQAGPTSPTELTRSAESTGNATSHPSDAELPPGLSKEPGQESVADASGSKADSGEPGNLSTGTGQSSKATSKGDSGSSEKGSSSGNDQNSWAAASSSATATAAAGAGLSGGDALGIFAKPSANSLSSTPLGAPAGVQLSSMISPDGAGAVPSPKASPSVLTHPSAAADQAELPGDSSAAYPTNQLNSAKMVERLGQAELRVGLQAGEFGRVDIRTSMLHNQFTTHISVERGELSKVLASELPGLQSRLSEQRFPAGSITLEQQSTGGSAAFGQGPRQNQTHSGNQISYNQERDSVATSAHLTEASASTGRLDVHI